MTNQWWSWGLAAIGVFGLWLTTRRDWRGYLVGLGVQVLWITYAIVTRQWGFIASAVAYGTVNAIGIRRWRAAKRAETVYPAHVCRPPLADLSGRRWRCECGRRWRKQRLDGWVSHA